MSSSTNGTRHYSYAESVSTGTGCTGCSLWCFLGGLLVGGFITVLVVTPGGRQAAAATGRRISSLAKSAQEAYVEAVSPE